MQREPSLKEVQEGIRDWYAEKSREFTSSNYANYKEDKLLNKLVEQDYQRFENRLDQERERLHTEFARRLRLDKPKTLARPKSKLLKEALASNALAKPLITANNVPLKYRWTEPSPLLQPEDFCNISEEEEVEEVEDEAEAEVQPELQLLEENFQRTNPGYTRQDSAQPSLFGGGRAFQPSAPSNSSLTTLSSSPNSFSNFAKMPQFSGFRTSTPVEDGGPPSQLPSFSISAVKPTMTFAPTKDPVPIPSHSDVKSSEDAETSAVDADSADVEIFAPTFLNNSRLAQWIQYYAKFHTKLSSDVEAFVHDQQQKDLRIRLSRTITDRINISTKKDASDKDLAQVLNFFYDLLEGKKVQSWDDSATLQIDFHDAVVLNFAYDTICSRYLEQIKWDLDLLDSISLVLASICLKAKGFYRVLCTKSLASVTLMSMSTIKIIDHVLSFGASPEAATQWIANEQAVFRLFVRVQLSLKSPKNCDTIAAQKVQGQELVKLFFTETVDLEPPVLLASAFVLGEIVENFLKPIKKHHRDFAASLGTRYFPSIRSRILDFPWDEHLNAICATGGLDDRAKLVLRVRNESLICVLENAIQKEEQKKTGV